MVPAGKSVAAAVLSEVDRARGTASATAALQNGGAPAVKRMKTKAGKTKMWKRRDVNDIRTLKNWHLEKLVHESRVHSSHFQCTNLRELGSILQLFHESRFDLELAHGANEGVGSELL